MHHGMHLHTTYVDAQQAAVLASVSATNRGSAVVATAMVGAHVPIGSMKGMLNVYTT